MGRVDARGSEVAAATAPGRIARDSDAPPSSDLPRALAFEARAGALASLATRC